MLLKSENMIGKSPRFFANMEKDKINVVMIICNHCPYVLFRMNAISQFVSDYKDIVKITAVNSNDHSPDTPDSKP